MFKLEQLFEGCYLVVAPTTQDLAKLFLRFQEHYESPNKEFRDRAFSLEEFRAWYTHKFGKEGQFSYYEDWGGFNIPGYILEKFYDGKFTDIQLDERWLLEQFRFMDLSQIYIIGVSEDNGREALEHEKSHALFYLNYSYRFRVNVLNMRWKKKLTPIRLYLRKKGYCEKVLIDETNAWLCFDDEVLIEAGLDLDDLRPLQRTLRRMYQRFMGEVK